jgi:Immunoglobulin domain
VPPNVHVSPHTQHHLAGSTAVLKCRANGLPTPDLSWQLDNIPLMTNEDDNGRRRYIFMRMCFTLNYITFNRIQLHCCDTVYYCDVWQGRDCIDGFLLMRILLLRTNTRTNLMCSGFFCDRIVLHAILFTVK